jgi:hypothetical protein
MAVTDYDARVREATVPDDRAIVAGRQAVPADGRAPGMQARQTEAPVAGTSRTGSPGGETPVGQTPGGSTTGVDGGGSVRFRRIVVDRDDVRLTVDVHPTLTVLVVRRGLERLVERVLHAALRSDEPGVHVELVDDTGRELLLFRPYGARSRVVDLETGSEVDGFLSAGADLDVDLTTSPVSSADAVARLSAVDQSALWEAADRLSEASREGARVLERVETGPSGPRFPFGRRAARERKAGRSTRTVTDALVLLEEAGARWRSLAGDVTLHQALTLRPAVEACARTRSRTAALTTMAAVGAEPVMAPGDIDEAAAVVATVLADTPRLPQVLALAAGDEAPHGLSLTLDLLPAVLADRQLLVVTSSPEVADWARLEAHAGRAAAVDLTL